MLIEILFDVSIVLRLSNVSQFWQLAATYTSKLQNFHTQKYERV